MPTRRKTQSNRRKSNDGMINVNELPVLPAENYLSTYVNHAEVGNSPWDFKFAFFEIVEDETGAPIREKKVRIVMSPQHAVAFSQILNTNIERWMEEHAKLPDEDIEKGRRKGKA